MTGACDGRETMDEHMAALALTSLSCSPASPIRQSGFTDFQRMLLTYLLFCTMIQHWP